MKRLDRVESLENEAEAHAARIAGKRLRYLLEPLRDEARAASPLVEDLKSLQDGLGELHDASTLEAEARDAEPPLPAVGRAALLQSIATREARAFAAFRKTWPARRIHQLAARTHALAARLDERSRRGIEIERKFLLSCVPDEARRAPSVTIDQGYLPGRDVKERIRRVRDRGRIDYVRTMKAGTGVVRVEVEEKTTKAVFDGLWRLTTGLRLRKRRFAVPAGSLTWEIDEFLDRDLVLAEVELPAEDTPIEIPDWLAPHLVREVSHERRYENHRLARTRVRGRRRA